MKHISTFVLRIEEVLAGAMLIAISALVFLSAIARTIGMPINWAQDISLLFFAWLTFIGADIVAKTGNLIRIDMLEKRFPKRVRKTMALIFDVAMLLFFAYSYCIWVFTGITKLVQKFPDFKNELCMVYIISTCRCIAFNFTIGSKFIKDIRTPMIEWGNN